MEDWKLIVGILALVIIGLAIIVVLPAMRQNKKEKEEKEFIYNFDFNIKWLLLFLADNGFVKQNLDTIRHDSSKETRPIVTVVCERLPSDSFFKVEVDYAQDVPMVMLYELKHTSNEPIKTWSFDRKDNHEDDLRELDEYFVRFS